MDIGSFATSVAVALQAAGYTVLNTTDRTIHLQAGKGAIAQIGLDNFYATYLSGRATLEQVTDTCLDLLRNQQAQTEIPDLANVVDRLYPQVQRASYLNRHGNTMITQPFLAQGELHLIYRIDSDRAMSAVTIRHMAHWGITPDTLHKIAVENLRRSKVGFYVYKAYGQPLYAICDACDGYTATRILQPNFLNSVSEQLNTRRLLIGIPNRDFLVAFPEQDAEIVSRFADMIEHDNGIQPYPISDKIFLWADGTLSVHPR
jgi:uncharacterized protein YtpQ (UPF0354 family)